MLPFLLSTFGDGLPDGKKQIAVHGAVAKRLCRGLQILPGRFDSGPRLQHRVTRQKKNHPFGWFFFVYRFFVQGGRFNAPPPVRDGQSAI